MKKFKIGVVMPVLNNYEMAVDTLVSIKTNYDWEPFIIDNYRHNHCLAASWNMGVKSAFERWCDYALVINDDIRFSKITIDALIDGYEAKKEEDCIMMTAHNVRGQIDPDDIFEYAPEAAFEYVEHPDFSCFLITPDTIIEAGWFDENFKPAYFEDNDYHRRIKLADKIAYRYTGAPFYHFGSRTQNKDIENPVVPPGQYEVNHDYYKFKWQGDVGQEKTDKPYGRPDLTHANWLLAGDGKVH